jgi:hypothetical protein
MHNNNNKTDFLLKFESLKWNSIGLFQDRGQVSNLISD